VHQEKQLDKIMLAAQTAMQARGRQLAEQLQRLPASIAMPERGHRSQESVGEHVAQTV
jgi:hypothetical protein